MSDGRRLYNPKVAMRNVKEQPHSIPQQVKRNVSTNDDPSKPVTLIEFTIDGTFAVERAANLVKENNDFLVIGIVGTQGSGKSTFLSSLHSEESKIFPSQSDNTIIRRSLETRGIQIASTHERILLLDTQPICSATILYEMLDIGQKLPSDIPCQEYLALKRDLEIGVFLLSVCHTVIAMDTELHNIEFWKYIKLLDMFKWNIPDVSTLSSVPSITVSPSNNFEVKSNEYIAELVFVYTKLTSEEIISLDIEQAEESLDMFFKDTRFSNKCEVQRKKIKQKTNGVNFYCLPDLSDNDFNELHKDLIEKIFSLNNKKFMKPITEPDWLRNSSVIWNTIQRSFFIKEYCRTVYPRKAI